ncbi:MAG TPA: hypothetical protein EYN67_04940 [Flavobacteriales bacterium]|nr:hypothetical protein [Flavobacteriales bacterium]
MAELAISTSNVLIGVTPTVTDLGVDEVAANVSDPDHSLNVTAGTSTGHFAFSYGVQADISYVAISGQTAATPASAVINLFDGVTLIDTVSITRNNNIMFTFPEMSFTDLIVQFVTVPNNYQMTVSFIAAGEYLAIEKGQQAGYARNWLNRHTTQRSNSTLEVGPISSTQRAKALKGTLSMPNELAIFTEDTWQNFIDFSYEQPFFIKEFEGKPESSYICYDPMPGVKSHPQTPTLDVITLKFTVFNGLT